MKNLLKVSLFVSAFIMAMPAMSTIASAKTCKNFYVSVSGAKKWTNLSARVSARTKWRRYVRQHYGAVWSVYALAVNKSYSCHRVGAKWRCKAIARPCRPF